jgi:hypothetical protein
MRLLIKIPTRERPQKFLHILEKYYSLASPKYPVHVLVSTDVNDLSMQTPEVRRELQKYPTVVVRQGEHRTKVEAVNSFVDEYDFDILLQGADDTVPIVEGYNEILADCMRQNYPDTDGVLWFNDGTQGRNLNTLAIMGRKYYQRFGYVTHPSYVSLWGDNEFTEIANFLGRQIYFDQVIFRHEHWIFGHTAKDALYERNDAYFQQDRENYLRRRSRNFDLNVATQLPMINAQR